MNKSIGRLITLLSRQIAMDLRDVIEPLGITPGEEPYFMALVHEEGISQDRLTEIVRVDKSATARMVKSLEKKGLIKREIDQEDKRNRKLFLTDRGRQLYPVLKEALSEYNRQLTSEWSDDQYELVYQSLQSIHKS